MASAADKVAALTREAVAAFQAGDHTKADRLFRQATASKAGGAQAAYNYAVFLRQTGSLDQASYWLTRCQRVEPNRPGARIEQALIAMARDEPLAALEALEPVRRDPDAAQLFAQAAYRLGRWEIALEAIESHPSPESSDLLLALRCHLELGNEIATDKLAADLGKQAPSLRAVILKALTRRATGKVTLDEGRMATRLGA